MASHGVNEINDGSKMDLINSRNDLKLCHDAKIKDDGMSCGK